MIHLPQALASLCVRHRISTDLPADLFIARCVDALASEGRTLQEVSKSVAKGYKAFAQHCPNPGIVRDERVRGFSIGESDCVEDPNACFDCSFPFLGE